MTQYTPRGFVDKFFRDQHGKWAIVQFPNVPIILWIVLYALSYFAAGSSYESGVNMLRDSVLFAWAYLEIAYGDSYFRRLLGTIVMAALIASYFI